jgi:hypothetical protein
LLLIPNYLKSTAAVYIETAMTLLRHPKEGPWLLSRVMHESRQVFVEDLPTWVPRWHAQSVYIHALDHPVWNNYHAGGKDAHFEPEFRPGNILALRGVIFDTITWVSEQLWEEDFNLDPSYWAKYLVTSKRAFINNLWEAVSGADTPTSETDLRAQFIMTLLCGQPPRETHWLEDFEAYCSAMRQVAHGFKPLLQNPAIYAVESRLFGSCYTVVARTSNQRLGLLPRFSEPGDVVCILIGVSTPFVLRTTGNGTYKLVGECYVDTVMKGQLVNGLEENSVRIGTVLIE